MSNWSNINTIYTYDGTFEGFLSVIFFSFETRQIPQNIVPDEEYIPSLSDDTSLYIETNYNKSSRVFDGLLAISNLTFYYIRNVFLSNEPNKDILLLDYIINAFKYGANINNMLTINSVLKVQKTNKRVFLEIARLKGFLRFIQVNDNLYYSKINPDNNILEFLCEHFKRRLPTQDFMIQDINRNLLGAYNSKLRKIEIINLSTVPNFIIPEVSNIEQKYQDMWKMFFKNIAIKERTNSRLQKQYMPRRYWKYMFEV